MRLETGRTVTPDEFAHELAEWYRGYSWCGKFHAKRGYEVDCFENAHPWISALERRLRNQRGLKRSDLVEIAEWGGGGFGLHAQIARTDNAQIVQCTNRALASLDDPGTALGHLLGIRHWGLTYASKTLRFVCPERYGALDRRIRNGIPGLPAAWPSSGRSLVRAYVVFLDCCAAVMAEAHRRGISRPTPKGGELAWRVADVEMAIFQFVSTGNVLEL